MLAVGRSEGVTALLQSIEPNSVSPSQLNLLTGEALAAEGNWQAAVEKYTQALKLNPQPAEVYYHLGRAYEQLKDPAKAAEAYRKAFEYTDQGKRLRQS
jgi:Flp pilus assembly protein TadD